jgi:hypothetical protein
MAASESAPATVTAPTRGPSKTASHFERDGGDQDDDRRISAMNVDAGHASRAGQLPCRPAASARTPTTQSKPASSKGLAIESGRDDADMSARAYDSAIDAGDTHPR